MPASNSAIFSTLHTKLHNWGANPYSLPPDIDGVTGFFDDTLPQSIETAHLDYEQAPDNWLPMPARPETANHPLLPQYFVDGKLSLHLIGGARDSYGYPRPILVGQIGAGYVRLDGASHVNASRLLMLNLQAVSEQDETAIRNELQNASSGGYFFLPYRLGSDTDADSHNFDVIHRLMYRRGRDEMLRWEREVAESLEPHPVCVDGRVRDHLSLERTQLVIGVIKRMRVAYLHTRGYEVRDALGPGERTPSVLLYPDGPDSPAVVTFYMRLSDQSYNPTRGIVRVEIRQDAFTTIVNGDFEYLDAITAHLFRLRCLRPDYARSHVTTEPIYEAEQVIAASFFQSSLIALEAQTFLFS